MGIGVATSTVNHGDVHTNVPLLRMKLLGGKQVCRGNIMKQEEFLHSCRETTTRVVASFQQAFLLQSWRPVQSLSLHFMSPGWEAKGAATAVFSGPTARLTLLTLPLWPRWTCRPRCPGVRHLPWGRSSSMVHGRSCKNGHN